MTTYHHTITLDDGEYIALRHILETYTRAPIGERWDAYKTHAKNILVELSQAETRMTSTNNFGMEAPDD